MPNNWEKAKRFYKQSQFAEAIEIYNELTNFPSTALKARRKLVECYFSKKDYISSKTALIALRKEPTFNTNFTAQIIYIKKYLKLFELGYANEGLIEAYGLLEQLTNSKSLKIDYRRLAQAWFFYHHAKKDKLKLIELFRKYEKNYPITEIIPKLDLEIYEVVMKYLNESRRLSEEQVAEITKYSNLMLKSLRFYINNDNKALLSTIKCLAQGVLNCGVVKNNILELCEVLENVSMRNPKLALLLNRTLAQAYDISDRIDDAIRIRKELIDKKPFYWSNYIICALLIGKAGHLKKTNLSEAIKLIQQVIDAFYDARIIKKPAWVDVLKGYSVWASLLQYNTNDHREILGICDKGLEFANRYSKSGQPIYDRVVGTLNSIKGHVAAEINKGCDNKRVLLSFKVSNEADILRFNRNHGDVRLLVTDAPAEVKKVVGSELSNPKKHRKRKPKTVKKTRTYYDELCQQLIPQIQKSIDSLFDKDVDIRAETKTFNYIVKQYHKDASKQYYKELQSIYNVLAAHIEKIEALNEAKISKVNPYNALVLEEAEESIATLEAPKVKKEEVKSQPKPQTQNKKTIKEIPVPIVEKAATKGRCNYGLFALAAAGAVTAITGAVSVYLSYQTK